MKRTLPILLAILGAVALTSVFVLLTRVGSWPANIRALDWRRVIGTTEDETVVETMPELVEAPA
jgi:hypothetical protein